MRNALVLLLSLLTALPAYGKGPLIWSGDGRARALNSGGIDLADGRTLDHDGFTNYVKDAKAESAMTPAQVGWTTYADAAGTSPVDCTGGSANVTLTKTTTAASLIEGNKSYVFTKDASNRQGQGLAFPFSLPESSPLFGNLNSLRVSYKTSADYAAGDMGLYLCDTTTGAVITPQYDSCGSASSGLAASPDQACEGIFYWQANSSSSTSYILAGHVQSTNASAYTVTFDDWYVGKRLLGTGPQDGPWTSFTPTVNNWSVTSTCWWRRSASDMLIDCELFWSGSAPTGQIEVDIPSVYTIDTASMSSVSARNRGIAVATEASSGNTNTGTVGVLDSNTLRFFGDDGTSTWNATNPVTWSSTINTLYFLARVPITQFVGGSALGDGLIEHACNSDTTNADTTASGLNSDCIDGVQFGSYDATRQKRSRFKTPYVPGRDLVFMEVKDGAGGGNNWQPHGGSRFSPLSSTTGMQFTQVSGSSTDFDTWFGSGGTSATPLAGAGAWSTFAGSDSYKWRLTKIRGGKTAAPVASATETGLVSTTTQTFAGDKTFNDKTAFGSTSTTEGGAYRVRIDDQDLGLQVRAGSGSSDFAVLIEDNGGTDLSLIRSDGVVTQPLQPYTEAYENTNVTGLTCASIQDPVSFDQEVSDIGGNYNTGTSTFTAPVTGTYMFCAYINMTASSALNRAYIDIVLGSTAYVLSDNDPATTAVVIGGCTVQRMTAAQTARVRAIGYCAAGTWGISGSVSATYFRAHLLN